MNKGIICKAIAIIIAVMLLITSLVPGVLAYVFGMTETIENIFIPIPPERFKGDFSVYAKVEHPFGEDYVYSDVFAFDISVNLGEEYANEQLDTSMGTLTADSNGVIKAKVSPDSLFSVKGIKVDTVITVTQSLEGKKGFTAKDNIMGQTITLTQKLNSVTFTNIYSPESFSLYDGISLSGDKMLDNVVWEEGDKFEFILEVKDGDRWVTVGKVTIDHSADEDGNFTFDDILKDASIDTVGEHQFRLSEVAGNMDEDAYDHSYKYFDLIITDKDMDGALELDDVKTYGGISHSLNAETGKHEFHAEFANTLAPIIPDDITVTIDITNNIDDKSGNNEDDASPEDFEFVLENVETGEKTIIKSDKDGKAQLDLVFTPDDVGKAFKYKLYPNDNGIEGAEYSDKVYDIAISIGKDERGQLTAALVCDGEPCDELAISFTTVYDPKAQFYSWPLIFTGAMVAAVGAAWPISTYSLRAVRKKKGIL